MRTLSVTGMRSSAVLWLLLVLFARGAFPQEIRYLSLEGDGTATVVVDKEAHFALIADGGRQGAAGIAGARIGNVDVLDFLEQQKVQRLVISCSHPHKDHMGGLVTLVSDARIKRFDVAFVAGEYEKSLALAYQRTSGRKAKFHSARQADGMGEAARAGALLRIRNFVYDPATVGRDEHDAAMIVEYEIGPPASAMRLVDFDDASEKLVAVWANHPGSRVDTVVVPHHGSRNNQITPLLENVERYGLKNAIIPVNRYNRYRHPAPEVLLALIEKLGPDHVFITGADPLGVVITKQGSIDAGIAARSRESLGAFIDGQIEHRQAEAWSIVNRDSAQNLLRRTAGSSADDLKAFIVAVGSATELNESDRRRLVRVLTDIETLQVARHRVKGAERKNVLAFIWSGKGLDDDPRSRSSSPEPPPEPPTQPGHGAYEEKLGEARAVHADMLRDSRGAPGAPGDVGPGGNGSSSGPGGGGGLTLFRAMLLTPMPVWGGVIMGNEVHGPRVSGLEFVADSPEEDAPPSSYSLVFTLEDGRFAEYAGVTPLELWAAYNFVQPTQTLTNQLDFELPQNAAGIVGMTQNDYDAWEFAVHPAIADSPLAIDAMRLDMLLSVAKRFAEFRPKALPAYLSNVPLRDADFDTYQWYDDRASISESNGFLRVNAPAEPADCLMRVRLIKANYPAWFDTSDQLDSVMSRVAEFAPGAPAGRIEELMQGGLLMPEAGDPAILAAIDRVEQELKAAKPIQDHSLNAHLVAACESFPSLVAMDRLAKVIALLNWYSSYGTQPLPALPASLTFPEHMPVAPRLAEEAVLGRAPPQGPMWLFVTIGAVAILLVAAILWGTYRGIRLAWRRLRA